MEEAIARGWADFISRLDGPMHLRFILQPAMAVFLAIRAGVRDAQQGEPPFLTSLGTRERRRERLRQTWKDIGKVFLVALLIDCIYQVRVHGGIYFLELLVTALFLAVIPYCLVCGPTTRIVRAWLAARDRKARHGG